MSPRKLIGLISTSPNPDAMAEFYRSVFGIPYELNQHGNLQPHYECDQDGIHYAILKGPRPAGPGAVVPSFQIDDLDSFLANLEKRDIRPLHKIMDLGDGPRVSTIADPDGNHVRLFAAH